MAFRRTLTRLVLPGVGGALAVAGTVACANEVAAPPPSLLTGEQYADLRLLQVKQAKALHERATAPAAKPEQAKPELELALKLLDTAISESDANPVDIGAAWRWRGTVLTALTDHMSTSDRIAASAEIRDAWTRAAELNPKDASAMHLLGRWYASMAKLTWLERNVASLLFGTPPPATVEEARDWFERAEATAPGFWLANRVKLAVTLAELGQTEEAKVWAERAMGMPVMTEDDRATRAELEALCKAQGWSISTIATGSTAVVLVDATQDRQ